MTNNWLYNDEGKWINNDTSFKLEYTSIYPCQLVRVAGKGDVLKKQGDSLGDYRFLFIILFHNLRVTSTHNYGLWN